MTTDTPRNVLLIVADQLDPSYLGAMGHRSVKTPNIDALARAGRSYMDASCASPICVPARAALATGLYPHQTHHWDNAHPYDGSSPSWGHHAQAAGATVTTIGKLHYKDGADIGFADQRLGMGTDSAPDYFSLLRDDIPDRPDLAKMVRGASAGNSSYVAYDRAVAAEAANWIRTDAAAATAPWVTMVSLVSPHHPLVAPAEYLDLYDDADVDLPFDTSDADRPHHPVLDTLRGYYGYKGEFTDDELRNARKTYMALVSFLDDQVGSILDALHETGAHKDTIVIFTADHGDNVGDHGLWWKNNMYRGAVSIPMVVAGPGIAPGTVSHDPVSQIDIYPTILAALGADDDRADLHGRDILGDALDADRPIFAEYHAAGSSTGIFMLKHGRYKYVEYVGEQSQLFDMVADPNERVDLAANELFLDVLNQLRRSLREFCDPDTVDATAKAEQRALVERVGGKEVVLARGFVTHMPVPTEIVGDFDDARASSGELKQ